MGQGEDAGYTRWSDMAVGWLEALRHHHVSLPTSPTTTVLRGVFENMPGSLLPQGLRYSFSHFA